MKPTIDDVIDRLANLENHLLFQYQGQKCGIDPITKSHYNIWMGEKSFVVSSIDDVMNSEIWQGKSLCAIFDDISIVDF